jgi:RimJ/RimL family protein N-acetyltransferase
MWIVETLVDRIPLGTVSIYNIDLRSSKAEWGRLYLVGDVRGKGYGKEISSLIYDYCFNHLNLNKLSCEVFANNTNVVELHKKAGNKVEGILRQHIYRFGKYHDIVRMSMLREDWNAISSD